MHLHQGSAYFLLHLSMHTPSQFSRLWNILSRINVSCSARNICSYLLVIWDGFCIAGRLCHTSIHMTACFWQAWLVLLVWFMLVFAKKIISKDKLLKAAKSLSGWIVAKAAGKLHLVFFEKTFVTVMI